MSATKLVLFIVLLSSLTSAARADAPWFNDEGDCKRHWGDLFNGARIRREADSAELAAIDLRIAAAESARDQAVKPKQDTAEEFGRIDEQYHDRETIFLPYLERTVKLCHELRELLVGSASKAVADARALVEMASISADRPVVSPEAAAVLGAATGGDGLALSLVLDSTLNHHTQPASEVKTGLDNIQTTDVGAILEKLETSLDDIERVNEALTRTVGTLTAENELMLTTEQNNLEALSTARAEALERKTAADRAYSDALVAVQRYRARKAELPDRISSESDNMTTAAHYRDSACPSHWYRRNFPQRDRGGKF